MTKDQAIKELQKEVASNPRLVHLLSVVVQHENDSTAKRMGRENEHVILVRLSENIACLSKFHTLITALVPKDRTPGA